jgi:hypothetical protein
MSDIIKFVTLLLFAALITAVIISQVASYQHSHPKDVIYYEYEPPTPTVNFDELMGAQSSSYTSGTGYYPTIPTINQSSKPKEGRNVRY